MSIPKQLVLVTRQELLSQDHGFLKFAALMGVPAKTVLVRDNAVFRDQLLGDCSPETDCLAISLETLMAGGEGGAARAETIASANFKAVFVFGQSHSSERNEAISTLTGGVISGMMPMDDPHRRFTLPSSSASSTHQLAGLSFSGGRHVTAATYELRDSTHHSDVILAANGRPVFVRVKRGESQIFLSTLPMPDVDEPLNRPHGLDQYYDRLIPVLIFLRDCFGGSCWHSSQRTGRLIIDDAVLTEKYGFLDYNTLSRSMHNNKYGTSVAFIPWNYWRTSERRASRIFDENPQLTICMHGCDHTNKEFEERDLPLLETKAALAVARMELHREQTGAPFEHVMVFPQGRFSTAAITALRRTRYLAAVNTTCFPINGEVGDLRVGDFLRPAVTRYDGFPIFSRRYPGHLFDFAFDLFMGRPAFVAEHHNYFRGGFEKWEEFVAQLHRIEPALSWPSLTDQLMRTCLKRYIANDIVEVQFFTRKFLLVNAEERLARFSLCKHEPDPGLVESVLVDGISTPFSFKKDFLNLELEIDPRHVKTIEIVDRQVMRHSKKVSLGIIHNSGVLLRRGLSEFRDNALAHHDSTLKAAKLVAKKLKITGDS
jgi:hypothetical protein